MKRFKQKYIRKKISIGTDDSIDIDIININQLSADEVNLYKNSINAGFSNIENLVNLRILNLNNNSNFFDSISSCNSSIL